MLLACAKAGDIIGAGWSHWPWATTIAPTPTRAATAAADSRGRDVEAQGLLTPREDDADAQQQQQQQQQGWSFSVKHCLVIMLSLQILLLMLFAPQLLTRLQQQHDVGGAPLPVSSNAALFNADLPADAADASQPFIPVLNTVAAAAEPESELVGAQSPITATLAKITPASAVPSRLAAAALPSRADVGAFEQCSTAHVASVTASLYASCPTARRNWSGLESVGSLLRRSSGEFTTRIKSEPASTLMQTFENVCLQGRKHGQYTAWVSVGPGHKPKRPAQPISSNARSNSTLTALEAEADAREDSLSQLDLDELGLFAAAAPGGPQQQYSWRRRRAPLPHWKYLPGTTIHQPLGSEQHLGRVLEHVRLAMTGALFPRCAGLDHPVDQILVDGGCADHTHAVRRPLMAQNRSSAQVASPSLASSASFPTDLVCPLHQTGSAAARWALRLSMLDPQTLPESPLFDARSVAVLPPIVRRGANGAHFVTLHEAAAGTPLSDGSGQRGPSICPAAELPGLCFERLVVPVVRPLLQIQSQTHQDSRNSSCGEAEDRAWLHRFRNATFRALQLPEPFLVLPGAGTVAPTWAAAPGARGKLPRVPRVLLGGQDDAGERRWVDVDRTRAALESLHAAGRIVLSFRPRLDNASFCELVRLFSQSDVVVMAHGSPVSAAAVWAPEGALLIEVLPGARRVSSTSWSGVVHRVLGLRVRSVTGTADRPSGRGRSGKKDGEWNVDPSLLLSELASVGIDVSTSRKSKSSVRLA